MTQNNGDDISLGKKIFYSFLAAIATSLMFWLSLSLLFLFYHANILL